MVILDGNIRTNMLTNGAHQYIQPDSFPSMSSALDVKSSPLAMLQKTCSQIGSDTLPPVASTAAERRARAEDKCDRPGGASASISSHDKSTFKPYELAEKRDDRVQRKSPAKSSGPAAAGVGRKTPKSVSPSSTNSHASSSSSVHSTKSASPITRTGAEVLAGLGAAASGKDLSAMLAGLQHRPGMMSPLALPHSQGGSYLSAAAAANAAAELSSLRAAAAAGIAPSSLFPHPALYGLSACLPGHPGVPPHLLPHASAFASLPPYLQPLSGSVSGPTLRCPNPYCTCVHPVDSVCSNGCVHCEQVRGLAVALGSGAAANLPYLGLAGFPSVAHSSAAPLTSFPSLIASSPSVSSIPAAINSLASPSSSSTSSPVASPPASSSAGLFSAAALPASTVTSSNGGSSAQPLVCSWMAEGRYCGKRFANTDELMNHLRSHTTGLTVGPGGAAPLAPAAPPTTDSMSAFYLLHQQQQQYQASLLAAAAAASGATSGASRGQFSTVAPSLSPSAPSALAAASARYHPYHQSLKLPPSLSPGAASVATTSSSCLPPAALPPSVSSLAALSHPGLSSHPSQASLAAAAAAAAYYPLAAAASLYGRHPSLP